MMMGMGIPSIHRSTPRNILFSHDDFRCRNAARRYLFHVGKKRVSERLRRFEHLLGVARNPYVAPDTGDLAVPADQESRADDAHIFPPERRLLAPRPVSLDRLARFIGGERRRKR